MRNFKKEIDKKLKTKQEKLAERKIKINEFHPHYLGYCKRQIFLSKLRMKAFNRKILGAMKTGTLVHNWIESGKEKTETKKFGKIIIKGRCDDSDQETIYEYKTINGLRHVKKKPKEIHLGQLECYMRLKNKIKGKIIYLDKNYLFCVEHEIERDDKRWKEILNKINQVKSTLEDLQKNQKIIISNEEDIPFKKCGCYFCENENLVELPYEITIKGEA